MSEALRPLVVDVLRQSRRPRSTAHITRVCGAHSTHAVAIVLRALQQEGLVAARPGGHWVWTGPLERRTTSAPSSARPPGRAATGTQSRSAPPQPHPDCASPTRGATLGGRWSTFRRLCHYYAECVRLEERSRLVAYANRIYQDFMPLDRGVDWAALSAGQPVRLLLDEREQVFVRKALAKGRHPRWFIGGPVDVYSGTDTGRGEEWVGLQPILYLQVAASAAERELTLHPTGVVEVNYGWLQKRFKRTEDRNEFLAAVGLTESEDLDQEDADEPPPLPIADFRAAYRWLAIGYPSWWKEFPSVERLCSTPPLEELRERGVYNRALLLVGPALQYSHRLVKELFAIADERADEELDQTALATLFPHEPPPAGNAREETLPDTSAAVAEVQLLNDEQLEAIEHSRVRPLTVLTGPPGTGKSVVVAHAMLNHALDQRSVLFASRNHQALEAVEPRLNALVEPELLVMRPSRPFGATGVQQEWQQALVTLLSKPRPDDASGRLCAARAALRDALRERADAERQILDLLDLRDALATVESELEPALRALAPGLEAYAWNADVAVPAPDEIDEVAQRLESAIGLRGASGLGGRLRRCWWRLLRAVGRDPLRPIRTAAAELLARFATATGQAVRETESEDVDWLLSAVREWRSFAVAHRLAAEASSIRGRVGGMPQMTELDTRLSTAQQSLQERTREALLALATAAGAGVSPEQRQKFAELRAGLENHRGAPSEQRFQKAFAEALPELLRHFPLWAVSNLSAHKAAPLQPGIFDLLVVDEASQCDIPSVVPLLFRARRLMAVGDPLQLRHISQLPASTDLSLRGRFGLVGSGTELERFSFRANSFYDLSSSSKHALLLGLRAHYRCHPDIAAFCNSAFYGGRLRVMTDRSRLVRMPGATESLRGCEWRDVRGEIQPATRGCYSQAMTEALIDELERLAGAAFEGSVGVVTPFRVQADRIRDRAHATLAKDQLDRWRFLVHTVDGFQGDERDVVLFALVGGADMPSGSRNFLASAPNRFNVAVSRARSFLRVLGDRSWAATCGIPFVSGLLSACTAPPSATTTRWDLVCRCSPESAEIRSRCALRRRDVVLVPDPASRSASGSSRA